MGQIADILLQILTQIGGGPASPENNLVRFALPAIFWAILLAVAWSRQRHGHLPRERLLVWGFGLAFFRELFMLAHMSEKLLNREAHSAYSNYVEPIEHALAISSVILIAAAFLRYILDDRSLPRRYLLAGLGIVIAGGVLSTYWWFRHLAVDPAARFNSAGPAWLLHMIELIFIAAAMVILVREKGWLSNIVILAFSFLFISELIVLINYLTDHAYGFALCPIGNNLHIWAVPIFGFVYFREQEIEKRQAEAGLRAYRDHLEDLVEVRTSELQQANKKLERTAVLEERQRIAAEMHDGLAQTLSTIGLKTGQAATLLQAGNVDDVLLQFDEIQDIIGRAVSDVRRSIASLRQDPLPVQSLQEALDQVIADTRFCENGTDLVFSWLDQPLYLNRGDQDQVLRVVQEALINACRHAQAQQITFTLERITGGLSITIADDGIGFDLDRLDEQDGNHFGLSIMRARSARLKGHLIIDSRPGRGTTVKLTWPAEFIYPLDDETTSITETTLSS